MEAARAALQDRRHREVLQAGPIGQRRRDHARLMLGILVHGDNHFIVRGPEPDRETALALVRHWSLIGIGAATPPTLTPWHISTREFREDLQWAIFVPGEGEISSAVGQLLGELASRGITIRYFGQCGPLP